MNLTEKEYSVSIQSIGRFLIAMIVILLSSTILVHDNLQQADNEIISAIQFVAMLVTSFYLARIIGTAKATITLTNEGVVHTWKRKFVLSRDSNHKIPWNLVDNYVFHEDRTFDSFTINLTNKTRYKLNKLNIFPVKDDFNQLVKEFPGLSNQFRKGIDTNLESEPIKKGKSIYENKFFRLWIYVLSFGFLALFVGKLFNPNSGISWSSLGVIGSGILFYGLMIKEHNN